MWSGRPEDPLVRLALKDIISVSPAPPRRRRNRKRRTRGGRRGTGGSLHTGPLVPDQTVLTIPYYPLHLKFTIPRSAQVPLTLPRPAPCSSCFPRSGPLRSTHLHSAPFPQPQSLASFPPCSGQSGQFFSCSRQSSQCFHGPSQSSKPLRHLSPFPLGSGHATRCPDSLFASGRPSSGPHSSHPGSPLSS